jgi:lactate dehydrogenase-like 2-hydroxyacid dehydrogenase
VDKPGLLVVGVLPDWDLEALSRRFTLHLLYAAPDREAFLARHGRSVRAIATKGELGADPAMMDACPDAKIIACYGVGVDAIDLPAARARGIAVTNTPGVLTEDVADMAFALLLATARAIPEGDAYVRTGSWARQGPMRLATRVWGKRLGIVGLGRIGSAIARRAEGFGMAIAYSGRSRKDVPYAFHPSAAALAPQVDILIVSAAGGAATAGLVDRAAIEALSPGTIFVNVSRGSVVDEAALIGAIRSGRIAAAGLDVFHDEPAIDPIFATFANVVLSPHQASGTVETRKAMGALMLENLEAHIDGRPLPTPVA